LSAFQKQDFDLGVTKVVWSLSFASMRWNAPESPIHSRFGKRDSFWEVMIWTIFIHSSLSSDSWRTWELISENKIDCEDWSDSLVVKRMLLTRHVFEWERLTPRLGSVISVCNNRHFTIEQS
jgi:hypothetical protein